MTTDQVLWGVNSFLFVILFFFVRTWVSNLKTLIEKAELNISRKLDTSICVERHNGMIKACDRMSKHTHTAIREDGSGGEVIYR